MGGVFPYFRSGTEKIRYKDCQSIWGDGGRVREGERAEGRKEWKGVVA